MQTPRNGSTFEDPIVHLKGAARDSAEWLRTAGFIEIRRLAALSGCELTDEDILAAERFPSNLPSQVIEVIIELRGVLVSLRSFEQRLARGKKSKE